MESFNKYSNNGPFAPDDFFNESENKVADNKDSANDRETGSIVPNSSLRDKNHVEEKDLPFAVGAENEIEHFSNSEQKPSGGNQPPLLIPGHFDHIRPLSLETVSFERIQVNEGLQLMERMGGVEMGGVAKTGIVYFDDVAVNLDDPQEEETTEVGLILKASRIISLGNNEALLDLSGIMQPLSELYKKEETNSARKISEETAIDGQTHANFYSSEAENIRTRAENKEDSKSCLSDYYMASKIGTSSPTVKENLSLPRQDIHDNSVLATTLGQDWRTKSVPAVSTNATYLDFSCSKESPVAELFPEIPLIEESSMIYPKYNTNNNYTANIETSVLVKETMGEDSHESNNVSLHSSSGAILVDNDLKWKDSGNYNNNDSNFLVDLSPSSTNRENEMNFRNSKEACSEIQNCPKRSYLVEDSSESKSSFLSNNNQSKDHNLQILKKIKSVTPRKVKDLEKCDFENNPGNFNQELRHISSQTRQLSDVSTLAGAVDSDLEVMTGNPRFHGLLTPIVDNTKLTENLSGCKNIETFDNPQQFFHQGLQYTEKQRSSKQLNINVKCSNPKQNSVLSEDNHSNKEEQCDENILDLKNNNYKSKENNNVVSLIASSDETTVIPQQRNTPKKNPLDSARNIQFSDDLFDLEPCPSPIFCPDKEQTDEYMSADEDGYLKLIPFDINEKIKAMSSHPVDKGDINLRPEPSDFEKNLDPPMDVEDSISTSEVNTDNEGKENDNIFSNLEMTVKLPQRTYARKKKT